MTGVFLLAPCSLFATPLILAESQLSLYSGFSQLNALNSDQSYSVSDDKTQNSLGVRYTNWLYDQWGLGIDYNSLSINAGDSYLQQSVTLNGLKRFENIPYLSPYIGFGLGVGADQYDDNGDYSSSVDWSDVDLVTSGFLGTQIPVTDQISLFGEVKLDHFSDAPGAGSLYDDQNGSAVNQSINFGVSLSF